jgi:hypothetical protein
MSRSALQQRRANRLFCWLTSWWTLPGEMDLDLALVYYNSNKANEARPPHLAQRMFA